MWATVPLSLLTHRDIPQLGREIAVLALGLIRAPQTARLEVQHVLVKDTLGDQFSEDAVGLGHGWEEDGIERV
jgi:hypothetical protein